MNWKVGTLNVNSTCSDRLIKISWILKKKGGKLFTTFVNQNGSSLYRQDSQDPVHSRINLYDSLDASSKDKKRRG